MAKTISANNVADAFAEYNSVIILDGIGGKNSETETATTYTVFVPESCAESLSELRTYLNNNWDAKLFKKPDGTFYSVSERLEMIPNIAANYTPSAAKSQTPLRRAVQNILCRMHPASVQGLSGQLLVNSLAPHVERFLATASLEKYQAQIEAELAAIAAETAKRSRRDGTASPSDKLDLSFETNEAA